MSRNSRTLRIGAVMLSLCLMLGFVWFKTSAVNRENGTVANGNDSIVIRSDSDTTGMNLIRIPIYSEHDWFMMSSSKVAMMVEPSTFSYVTNDTSDHRRQVILPDSIFEKLKKDSVHLVPGIQLPPKKADPDLMIIPSTKSEPVFRPNQNANDGE